MPEIGDNFIVTLGPTHIDWGNEPRKTDTRNIRLGENYIPIPFEKSKKYSIYNSNKGTGLGINEFYARSSDGNYNNIVKTTGSVVAGSIYAKNLHEKGNLKGFGKWFSIMNVTEGTRIKIEWISNKEILMTIL